MLRERTATSHAQVETTLDLLAPTTTLRRLGSVVAHLHAFFATVEPRVDEWAEREPGLAGELDWPRRRRVPHLAADLAVLRELGVLDELLPTCAPAPEAERLDTADVLGWLYVAEGSTLGGAVIARRTAALTAALPGPLRTFSPYPEGPGPMWRAFGDVLARWTGADGHPDESRMHHVADAAAAYFSALESWVAPLRGEDAA